MRILALLLLSSTALCAFAQDPWQATSGNYAPTADLLPVIPRLERSLAYRLDTDLLRHQLAQAPLEDLENPDRGSIITLPTPSGISQRFLVVDSPILTDELAARIPIKTYAVQGIDNPSARGRIDFGTYGFHGIVFSPTGDYVIDPIRRSNIEDYVVYYRRDAGANPDPLYCLTNTDVPIPSPSGDGAGIETTGPNLMTFRLALNTTQEYTAFHGGSGPANAAVVTTMNRVNGVYINDVAVRMTLVYVNCWVSGDPFDNANGGLLLGQNQTNLDSAVGNANYDVGHIFSTGGGGVAGLGVVGITGQKARGVTGLGAPVGDAFDIDYVAHEMGHQFGGRHTFNGTTGACNGNRSSVAAYEPGSGSTIQAYAGICGAENLQSNSDPYFHVKSIEEILPIRNDAARGGVATASGNGAPTVNAGLDTTIPIGTPFKLTAVGSDPNGHPLTYCWEQYDLGTASPTTNNATRPLFRSFNPSTSPTRFFPRLADVLSGAATPWEILPTVARTLTFQCTVRDNRTTAGGVESDTRVLTVSGAAMAVTAPNTNVTWFATSQRQVTWTVGGSATPSPNVRILLSTDGGNSYGTGTATVLANSVPNNGSATVTIPNITSNQARIFVESSNGVFYDVSNVNFSIARSQVSGTVTLQSWGGVVIGRPITIELFNPGGTTPIQTINTTLNTGGAFLVPVGIINPGNYDIRIKASHWLARRLNNFNISAAGASGANVSLFNGDVNNDNEVGAADFSQLAASYDLVIGDAGYNAEADLNGDDEVGAADFSILAANYDREGQ